MGSNGRRRRRLLGLCLGAVAARVNYSMQAGHKITAREPKHKMPASKIIPPQKKSKNVFFRLLGPGLVTGAADDDPSGIATYSQAGAQFGYGLLWTVFLTTPFMIAIQLVSARIGRVTGKGLAANVMELAPRWLVLAFVFLLVLANSVNIGADLTA